MSNNPHVVIGEVASEGKVLPQLGSVAMQSGEHVALQISRRLAGESAHPFKYWDKGFMATIGRGAAVVEFPNQRTLQGPLAYFAWLAVHLTLLTGMRKRIETLWNWVGLRSRRTEPQESLLRLRTTR